MGTGGEGGTDPVAEEHRVLRPGARARASRWSAARTTAGRRPARTSSWSTAPAAASAATACGIACSRTARRPSATACRSPSIADTRDLLADIYIKTEVQRLFGLRNFWLTYAKRPRSYEGPQLSYYRKMTGLWMTGAILEAVGPAALTTDETWGSPEGFLELQQRNGIVAVHPGGTADIQRVSMARRIGIGRAAREAAGTVH